MSRRGVNGTTRSKFYIRCNHWVSLLIWKSWYSPSSRTWTLTTSHGSSSFTCMLLLARRWIEIESSSFCIKSSGINPDLIFEQRLSMSMVSSAVILDCLGLGTVFFSSLYWVSSFLLFMICLADPFNILFSAEKKKQSKKSKMIDSKSKLKKLTFFDVLGPPCLNPDRDVNCCLHNAIRHKSDLQWQVSGPLLGDDLSHDVWTTGGV